MKLQKVRTRKKKLKNKVIQTGGAGGWPPLLQKLNDDILAEETNFYFQKVDVKKV